MDLMLAEGHQQTTLCRGDSTLGTLKSTYFFGFPYETGMCWERREVQKEITICCGLQKETIQRDPDGRERKEKRTPHNGT